MPRKTKPAQPSGSPVKHKQQTLLSHFSSSPVAPTRRKGSGSSASKSRKVTQTRVPDSGSDAEVPVLPIPKRSNRARRQSLSIAEDTDSSDVAKIHFQPQSLSDESSPTGESNSGVEPLSPRRPAKRRRISNSESEASEVQKSPPRNGRLRRLAKRAQKEEIETHSESGAEDEPTGRLVKGKRPPSGNSDILSGIDEDRIIDNRLRVKLTQKSKFMKNLEKLKKRKRGQVASESEGEVSEDGGLIPGARPDGGHDETEASEESDSEEELDDFIVEDEGNGPTAALPAIFSMITHQDLVHHFKVVCQYLVHLAVTTPAARSRISKRLTSDEYFSIPLSIARRKLADIRDSIASSVWRPSYKKALMTYPEFELHSLDLTIPHCDACNLGGRLSTLVGRLGGEPYDRTTFEVKRVDSESSSDESDNDAERTPPEFNLGRFCARRTHAFHELCHWEHQAFSTLLREVEELSSNGRGFVRIGYTESVQIPEDVSDADQVMEWLDRRGIIGAEWLKVKQMMSRATNLEADVKRGEAD